MSDPTAPDDVAKRTVPFLAGSLVLLPLAISVVVFLVGQVRADEATFLDMPDESHETCVLGHDTAYMRFHHMNVLKELRDWGVRDGRERRATFLECVKCHTSRVEFCDRCHVEVNLFPDCFTCHYYP